MATFNQQHQTVVGQVNAETVYLDGSARILAEQIAALIAQQSGSAAGQDAGPVLREAHVAAVAGNRDRALKLLRAAAEVAGPLSALAVSVAAIVQALS